MHSEAGGAPPLMGGLRVTGRPATVVGGGPDARTDVEMLLAAGAVVTLIAPLPRPELRGYADAGVIRWRRRRYRCGDLATAWLACARTGDPPVDAAVAAEAAARRIFCFGTSPAATAVAPWQGDHQAPLGPSLGVTRPGVALVGGGPGDPELITVRGRRLVLAADVVVVDRLGPRALLAELGPHVEVIDASKVPFGPGMAQHRIHELLIEHARAGRFVVRLKGGDPFVFGRGYEEVLACVEAGIAVTVVPGVSSAFAVPAVAGIPVSHRGVAHEIVVVSGHAAPGDHRSLVDWAALGRLRGTVVLMMSVENLAACARALVEHGRAPETPVAVIQDGSMPLQRTVRATLATVADRARAAGVTPPAVVVVGPVAGLGRGGLGA